MYLLYGVHYPLAEKRNLLIQAMHSFAEQVKKEPGITFVDVFANVGDGTLISVAIWESKKDFDASWPRIAKYAPSQEWEYKPREVHFLESV